MKGDYMIVIKDYKTKELVAKVDKDTKKTLGSEILTNKLLKSHTEEWNSIFLVNEGKRLFDFDIKIKDMESGNYYIVEYPELGMYGVSGKKLSEQQVNYPAAMHFLFRSIVEIYEKADKRENKKIANRENTKPSSTYLN